jgi:hypothetical protein
VRPTNNSPGGLSGFLQGSANPGGGSAFGGAPGGGNKGNAGSAGGSGYKGGNSRSRRPAVPKEK